MTRLLLFALLLCSASAFAATYTASSCTESAVQTAVNLTSNGDTVIIPACSQTNWGSNTSGDIPLSVSTDITIQGAGQGSTTIGDNIYKGGSGCSNGEPLINWTTTSGVKVRLTALTMVGVATDPGVCQAGHFYFGGVNHLIEVDHITINPAQTVGIRFVGDLWGVVSTISFTGNFVNGVRVENGLNWNGFSTWNDQWGDSSWNTAISYGGGQGIYVETSTFTSTSASAIGGATDCFSGGQIVFRYNTVSMLNNQSHGSDSDQRHRSCRWQEIYNNTYIYSNISQLAFIAWIRGGTGVFYNNTVTASGYSNKIVQVVNCRDASAGCGGGPNYTPWGACNGSATNDENSTGTGYRCVDQPGAGTSCLLGPDSGGTTVTVAACSLNGNVANGWTGNQLDPIYVWNNTLNGSSTNTTSGSTNETLNQDYYVGTARPGYTPYTYPHPLTNPPCGPPTYYCSTTSTANPGLAVAPFVSSAPTAHSCTGDCVAAHPTRFDTTLNPAPHNPISRLTDGLTYSSGASVGGPTCSGGDTDDMGSQNETFAGIVQGGFANVYLMSAYPDGSYQRIGTGVGDNCPIAFSQITDNVYWHVTNGTQLYKKTIGVYPAILSNTEIYDIYGTAGSPNAPYQCPGLPSGMVIAGVLHMRQGDDGRTAFAMAPSGGGQGSGDWVIAWDATLGCTTADMATGQYWAWTTTGTSSTAATGSLVSTGCYGSQGSTLHGIHDSQMTRDGNYLFMSFTSGGWTGGACNGQTFTTQYSIWQIGTSGDQWGYGAASVGSGGSAMGSHDSVGSSHVVTPYFGGPNIRLYSNVVPFTTFYSSLPVQDFHAAWPNPLFDDSYPWVGASDLALAASYSGCASSAPAYCPTYLNNVIFALFPNAAYPPGQLPVIFTHTFSCGEVGGLYATCPGGTGDADFGGYDAIGYTTAKGHWFIWDSTMFNSLGNDNTSVPRQDAFAVSLDGGPSGPSIAPATSIFARNQGDIINDTRTVYDIHARVPARINGSRRRGAGRAHHPPGPDIACRMHLAYRERHGDQRRRTVPAQPEHGTSISNCS